jgi:hypothetical protein
MGVYLFDSAIEESKDAKLRTAFIQTATDLTDERYSKLMKENNIEKNIAGNLNRKPSNKYEGVNGVITLEDMWGEEIRVWYDNSLRLAYSSYRRIIVKQPPQSFFKQAKTQDQIDYEKHVDELLLKHYNTETE